MAGECSGFPAALGRGLDGDLEADKGGQESQVAQSGAEIWQQGNQVWAGTPRARLHAEAPVHSERGSMEQVTVQSGHPSVGSCAEHLTLS